MRVHVRLRPPGINEKSRWQDFVYPVPPAPRTAVLVNWFRDVWSVAGLGAPAGGAENAIRYFAHGTSQHNNEALQRFAPAAIAATLDQLLAVTDAEAVSVTHALVILRRPGSAAPTEFERDLLWMRCGVPLFEQIIGPRGRLLAAECEAHNGLHVTSHTSSYSGAPRALLPEPNINAACPCGRIESRIYARPIYRLNAALSSAGKDSHIVVRAGGI